MEDLVEDLVVVIQIIMIEEVEMADLMDLTEKDLETHRWQMIKVELVKELLLALGVHLLEHYMLVVEAEAVLQIIQVVMVVLEVELVVDKEVLMVEMEMLDLQIPVVAAEAEVVLLKMVAM